MFVLLGLYAGRNQQFTGDSTGMLKYPKSLGCTIVAAVHKNKEKEQNTASVKKNPGKSPESSLPLLRENEEKNSAESMFCDD